MPTVEINGSETPAEILSAAARKRGEKPDSVGERKIRPGSYINLVWLETERGPKRRVHAGHTNGPLFLSLDEGLYQYSCSRPMGNNRVEKFVNKFYVGCDGDMWRKYGGAVPTNSKCIIGHEKVYYHCTKCGTATTTQMGAWLHEQREHFGKDPFEADEYHEDGIKILGVPESKIVRKRPVGRPRKDAA